MHNDIQGKGTSCANSTQKRSSAQNTPKINKKRKLQSSRTLTGSVEEVLAVDVRHLITQENSLDDVTPKDSSTDKPRCLERFTEIDLTINSLSSTGDGLARSLENDYVCVVPFTAPGDLVRAKVIRHDHELCITYTDFLHVIKPSPHRDNSLIKCRHFANCSGCQFQMLPYSYQLSHKKTILQNAYANFSGLEPKRVPEIGDTIGSPLQYGYRTKLTPHFDGPPGRRKSRRNGESVRFEQTPPIGFMKKGTKKTLDIEECPIGTPAVQMGLKRERTRVERELGKYKRGATLLLRESTTRFTKDQTGHSNKDLKAQIDGPETQAVEEKHPTYTDLKICITDPNATSTEYVSSHIFTNPAGAFFQNNNSILPVFTEYIRSVILPQAQPLPDDDSHSPSSRITNLLDAYSGSGLFTITLSSLFQRSVGIDISASSIKCATHNAQLNNLPDSVRFMAADANALFTALPTAMPEERGSSSENLSNISGSPQNALFVSENTVVLLDPPRKGCDQSFLRQLLEFGPERIVYVSCNVHTQARDVGWLLNKGHLAQHLGDEISHEEKLMMVNNQNQQAPNYEIESLRGFDFFPQTGHVEGVAVLRRVRDDG